MYRQKTCPFKTQAFSSFELHNSLNMSSSASPCVQIPSSARNSSLLSLSSINPKTWIISFGKFILLFSLSIPLYLSSSARSSLLSVLGDAIAVGHLTISDSEGTHYYGKYKKDCNDVHLQVINDNFWFRILLWAILSFVSHTPILLYPADKQCRRPWL